MYFGPQWLLFLSTVGRWVGQELCVPTQRWLWSARVIQFLLLFYWQTGNALCQYAVGWGKKLEYFFFFFINFIYLFIIIINFWLCWVFVSARGLPLAAASGGHSSSRCAGLSLSRPLLLRSPGSRRAGSVVVAHGPSRSAAHGILPDQGSNLCPLHWQADSQPLRHQGSPLEYF